MICKGTIENVAIYPKHMASYILKVSTYGADSPNNTNCCDKNIGEKHYCI